MKTHQRQKFSRRMGFKLLKTLPQISTMISNNMYKKVTRFNIPRVTRQSLLSTMSCISQCHRSIHLKGDCQAKLSVMSYNLLADPVFTNPSSRTCFFFSFFLCKFLSVKCQETCETLSKLPVRNRPWILMRTIS